jgi:hypothetical protein
MAAASKLPDFDALAVERGLADNRHVHARDRDDVVGHIVLLRPTPAPL